MRRGGWRTVPLATISGWRVAPSAPLPTPRASVPISTAHKMVQEEIAASGSAEKNCSSEHVKQHPDFDGWNSCVMACANMTRLIPLVS